MLCYRIPSGGVYSNAALIRVRELRDGRRLFEYAGSIRERAPQREALIRIRRLFARELHEGRRLFQCGVYSRENSMHEGRRVFECGAYSQLCFMRRGVLKAALINKRALRVEAFIRIRGGVYSYAAFIRERTRYSTRPMGGVYSNTASIRERTPRREAFIFQCGVYSRENSMHEGRRVFECGAYSQLCFIKRGVLKAALINKRALRVEAFIRMRRLFARELPPRGVYSNVGSIFSRELRDGRCLFECGIYLREIYNE